jgi:4-amino-4-deoxy-L-arabinose transferase-like glycosyltransferase
MLSFLTLGTLCLAIVLHAAYPGMISPDSLSPLLYLLAGASAAATASGGAYATLRYPRHMRAILFVVLITVSVFLVHLYTINLPATADCYDSTRGVHGCVMDEVYYVPAAQTMLSGAQCAPYADNCNLEHPFLSKAFVAAGIQIFGLNDFGWRFFQVLLGTLSVPLLFGLCWMLTKKEAFSYLATIFFATDTLFFVHSSIAVIDVHAIFFALLAFILYFSRVAFWRFDNFILSGIALGLSGLSKETSIFFVLFLLTYNLFLGQGNRRTRLLTTLKIGVAIALVFVAGLQLYDSLLAPSLTFVDHLKFILSYGSSLRGGGWTDGLLRTIITPIDWFLYYTPVGYLVTTVTVQSGGNTSSYIGVGYFGVSDRMVVWLTFVWAPYVLYLSYKKWRTSKSAAEESLPSQPVEPANGYRLAVFSLVLLAWTYLPYFALYLWGRVTYPYYMIQSIPGLAMGCAYFVTRPWFPKLMVYVLTVAVVGWFFIYYPDKNFLPTWIRIIIGR